MINNIFSLYRNLNETFNNEIQSENLSKDDFVDIFTDEMLTVQSVYNYIGNLLEKYGNTFTITKKYTEEYNIGYFCIDLFKDEELDNKNSFSLIFQIKDRKTFELDKTETYYLKRTKPHKIYIHNLIFDCELGDLNTFHKYNGIREEFPIFISDGYPLTNEDKKYLPIKLLEFNSIFIKNFIELIKVLNSQEFRKKIKNYSTFEIVQCLIDEAKPMALLKFLQNNLPKSLFIWNRYIYDSMAFEAEYKDPKMIKGLSQINWNLLN